MQYNNEGVSQRGNNIPNNPINDDGNNQQQFPFQKQRTLGKQTGSSQKRMNERERKNIKGHVFLEPAWNNSFGLENPFTGILAILFIAIYLYVLFFTQQFETDQSRIIWGVIVLVTYIVECCFNDVPYYLKNQMTVSELQHYLEELKQKNIELKFDVSAYHYEYRQHYNSSKKQYESRSESITTYKETFEYPISQCVDETEDSTVFFEKAKFFRIHSFVSYSFGNQESAQYYDEMIKHARNKSKNRDTHQTESESQNCQGLKTNILAYSDNTKIDPMFSISVYIIYCMIGMSFLYRILLNRRVCFVEHSVHKKVYLDNSRVNIEIVGARLFQQSNLNQQQILLNQQLILNQQQQILQNQNANNPLMQNQQPNQPNYNYPPQNEHIPNPMQ